MKKSLYIYPFIFFVILFGSPLVLSQEYKIFKTGHATIYYLEDSQLSDFLWKIGHLKLTPAIENSLVKNRVDRIIERVEAVLDMYPDNFHTDIFLRSGYKDGDIAFYSDKTESITVFVDRVTDGVLAHEVAHAVIIAYFRTPPPAKIQEILCRYADAQLWCD